MEQTGQAGSNWNVDGYRREVQDIAARAESAKTQLQQISSQASSSDGAVTVTVNVSGALQSLTFGPKADDMPRAKLGELVVSTAHRAQAQAAQQLTSVMAPVIGENSDAMGFLKEQIPEPVVADEPDAAPERDTRVYNEEQAQQSGFRPAVRRPRPQRRDDDDGDEGFGSIMRGGRP